MALAQTKYWIIKGFGLLCHHLDRASDLRLKQILGSPTDTKINPQFLDKTTQISYSLNDNKAEYFSLSPA